MTDDANADLLYFRANRGRYHRCRLATPAEIRRLERKGALERLGPAGEDILAELEIFAFVRYDRQNVRLEAIYLAFEQLPGDGAELSEQQCREAWDRGDAALGRHIARPQ